MSVRILPSVLALGTLVVASAAHAAPSDEALQVATEALRLDFAKDGVVASLDQIAGRYQEACDRGYEPACAWATWRDENGIPDVTKTIDAFRDRCGRHDPVACIVAGWAVEAEPLPSGLSVDERLERTDQRLGRAYPHYATGCDTGFPAACHELARYSVDRFRLGVGEPRVLAQRERGGKTVFDIAGCRKGFAPSCVELGRLMPQDPSAVGKRGSAGALYTQACEDGHVDGCYQLNVLLEGTRSVEDNRSRFDDLCDRGHTASCVWVARSYTGSGERSEQELDAWRRACMVHDPTGCRIAGEAIENDAPESAIAVHQMGCALGEPTSCGHLGLLLAQQDRVAESITPLDKGCAAGMTAACVKIGLLRLDGRGLDPNPERARADLTMGCPDDGERDPRACNALGRLYEDGFGVARDRAHAARYYRFACLEDNLQACFRLGEAVQTLQRASQTDVLLEWSLQGYVRACDSGIEQACLPAAELFESGPSSIRDVAEARSRLDSLCEDGNAMACRRLGRHLVDRGGDDSDFSHARTAFGRGMELGDSESTRQLAKMLWYGKGGPRKRGKARRLFRKACRDGNGSACGGIRQPDYARP